MHLLVDFLALIYIGPLIGKERFHFADSEEWAVPENCRLGLEPQVREVLVVLLAEVAIDLEETIDEFPGAVRVQLGNYLLKKRILYREVPCTELLGKYLEPETGCRFGARRIARVDDRHGIGRHVPWECEE